jgi:hypothetical protein
MGTGVVIMNISDGNVYFTNNVTAYTLTVTTLVLPTPISACPSGSGWSYYNGTNAVCSVFGNVSGSGTINQLPKFTAAGVIGDSGITFDGSNMKLQGNVNMTSTGTCIYLPGGGRLCGNSTCSSLYSPA